MSNLLARLHAWGLPKNIDHRIAMRQKPAKIERHKQLGRPVKRKRYPPAKVRPEEFVVARQEITTRTLPKNPVTNPQPPSYPEDALLERLNSYRKRYLQENPGH